MRNAQAFADARDLVALGSAACPQLVIHRCRFDRSGTRLWGAGSCTSLPGMSEAAETLRRSPLHDRHLAAGAKLIPFAGWEMPV